MQNQTLKSLRIIISLILCVNIALWFLTRNMQVEWGNVPPVPSKFRALTTGAGDEQFSFRIISVILQNFGNTGGRTIPIKDYDFEALRDWFYLQNSLDPRSDFPPMLAAFYFGASQDPTKLRPIIQYLADAGNNVEGEKWRWLAHAVYLSRFKLKDLDLALELAEKLSVLNNPEMPMWARQMPVNVLNEQGEKQAALQLILQILDSSADDIHPNEVNALVHYICNQILDKDEAKDFPLCKA